VGHKTVGGRVAQVKELNCPDGPPCDELMMGLVIWYTSDFFSKVISGIHMNANEYNELRHRRDPNVLTSRCLTTPEILLHQYVLHSTLIFVIAV
jgi:hypothetical protein